MSLFVPHVGWLIRFTEDCGPDDSPLGEDYLRHTQGLFDDEFPEVVLSSEYDPAPLDGNPRVVSVRRVWYFTDYDEGGWDVELSGRYVNSCMGHAMLYEDRDEALENLARFSERHRLIWCIWQDGPTAARPLARTALDGQADVLPILADALEDAGDLRALEVRQLVIEG